MSTRKAVTPEEVVEFFRLYEKHGSFAEVARQTGRAATTIARYINMKGVPKAARHAAGRKIGK